MNIFKRWRREAMRQRLADAVAFGYGMAHMLSYRHWPPSHYRHRAEVAAYWRGINEGVRDSRRQIDVQQKLDEIADIVRRYRAMPSLEVDLGNELLEVILSLRGNIDERQEELYKAVREASDELRLYFQPDIEFTLAEIEAEKRRSAERRVYETRLRATA